jgi:hypothetical protein
MSLAARYDRGMIETLPPLVPTRSAMTPAPEPAPLLEQLTTPRLENAALRGSPRHLCTLRHRDPERLPSGKLGCPLPWPHHHTKRLNDYTQPHAGVLLCPAGQVTGVHDDPGMGYGPPLSQGSSPAAIPGQTVPQASAPAP